jgi:Carboxypeptidase regulatory-like domain
MLVILLPGCQGRRSATVPAPNAFPLVLLSSHDTIEPGVLHGQVQSNPSGLSVSEALVSIDGGLLVTRTDASGQFAVHGLSPGRHHVEVRKILWWPTRGSIQMPSGGGAVLRVLMETPHNCFDCTEVDATPVNGRLYDVP